MKQLPTLVNAIPAARGLAGHVLVAVEDDLRAERRMPRHLDRHMPPLGVDDVKRIVVDVFASPLDVDDRAGFADRFTFHTGAGALATSTRNTPMLDLVGGQVLLGDAVLALAGLAEDHRHPVGRAPRLDPPREPPGQPHQMGVVQLGVAVVVPAPPPHPEPARVMPEREERVEHDPIHAVIAAGQQIRIPQAELVAGHPAQPTKPPALVR